MTAACFRRQASYGEGRRPTTWQVRVTTRARLLGESPLWLSGVGLLVVVLGVDLLLGRQVNGAYGGAAVLTAVYADPRRTKAVAGAGLLLSVASGTWHHNLGERDWALRLATCTLICALALVSSHANESRRRRLLHTTTLAQRVLDSLAVELTGARTVKEVADGFLGNATAIMGATSAMTMSLDDDGVLRRLSWHGPAVPAVDQYREIPLSSDAPGAVAVRERRDIHYRSLAEIVAAFPDLAGQPLSERSLHLLPLQRGDRAHGVLAVTFPPDHFTEDEDGFLHSMAGALTAAIERAAELQRADAAAERTRLLAEVSMSLSRTLDTAATLAECGRILVPRFADWSSVRVLRDGVPGPASVTAGELGADGEALLHVFPAARVAASGRSELLPYVPAELLEAAAIGPEHLATLRSLAPTSAMVVPLRGHDGVLGTMTLVQAGSARHYAEEDVAFLEAVAERVAVALETAATFEQQSERLADVTMVADAAQRAILAPPPPRAGPVALAARYRSATTAAQVGGDLYEVVPGPTSVRLLVGDVRGKGLSAVRTATVVLGEFRAAAAGGEDVAHVAREIDRRILPYLPDAEDFVTAVLVDIRDDGSFDVVSCGHPAPYLLPPSGQATPVVLEHSPPLGLGVDPVASHGRLAPGDRMLLFTDGLIEARDPDGGFVDPEPFLATMGRGDLGSALDHLLQSLTRAAGHALEDDLALVLACYDPVDGTDRVPSASTARRG